jgi:hypothetical protein
MLSCYKSDSTDDDCLAKAYMELAAMREGSQPQPGKLGAVSLSES